MGESIIPCLPVPVPPALWEGYLITFLVLLRHRELLTALLMDLWVESMTLCTAFLPAAEQLTNHTVIQYVSTLSVVQQ